MKKSFNRKTIAFLSLPLPMIVRLIIRLPFSVLHTTSRGLSFILSRVIGYRRKVVMQNLRNSFPEKPEKELQEIADRFYSHMGDVFMESLKAGATPAAEIKKRIVFDPGSLSLVEKYYSAKKNLIVLLGHYGIWEWVAAGFNLQFPGYMQSAYKPLKNPVIDRMIMDIRFRFCDALVPSEQVARHLMELKQNNQYKAFAMIADQAPSKRGAWWFDFLNQDTPFFTGAEKLAHKLNFPVIFVSIRKQKRGYYQIYAREITSDPSSLPEQEITRRYAALLEKEIKHAPEYWLWTHRRWKHKRDVDS
jgi:Kdo2-lipid IVA lauroyltransferase/acyltransferase